MKRLILTLILTGLAYPASGNYDPLAPLGQPLGCDSLSQIMRHSQQTLLFLTNVMWDLGLDLEKNPNGSTSSYLVFGGVEPPTSGKGDYFNNLEKLVRSATHAHEMARDAYESACIENDK